MNAERLKRPESLWLLAAGCVLLAVLARAGWTVVAKYRQVSEQLADIGPRHARLAGMLQNKELFAQSASALQANLASIRLSGRRRRQPDRQRRPAEGARLATARGLRVASSQSAAPARREGGLTASA